MLTFAVACFFILITPGPGVLSTAGVGSAFGRRLRATSRLCPPSALEAAAENGAETDKIRLRRDGPGQAQPTFVKKTVNTLGNPPLTAQLADCADHPFPPLVAVNLTQKVRFNLDQRPKVVAQGCLDRSDKQPGCDTVKHQKYPQRPERRLEGFAVDQVTGAHGSCIPSL